jgi:hypothetical protein
LYIGCVPEKQERRIKRQESRNKRREKREERREKREEKPRDHLRGEFSLERRRIYLSNQY